MLRLDELSKLLWDCVHAGASINFILPFSLEESKKFWLEKVLPGLKSGRLLLLVAERQGQIVGSVQLDIDLPPNQAHRGEVRKLMVAIHSRQQGIAKMLMAEIEDLAKKLGRSLLTLDTRTGDEAEHLYTSLGYKVAGMIPDYCRDPHENKLDPTTLMYKKLI